MYTRLRQYARSIQRDLNLYRLVLADPRTPWLPKALLGLAVGYLLLPFDLIPDFIPILGQLDDLIIVPGLVWLALKRIPPDIIEEHTQKLSPPSIDARLKH